jgi:hypothetical protein
VCKWKNVTKWTEDVNNFYLFVEDDDETAENDANVEDFIAGDCIIISKKGFTQCTARDMKQLCAAIMQARKEEQI